MHLADCVHYLAEDGPGVVLRDPPLLLAFDLGVQRGGTGVLHHQLQVLTGLNAAVELYDVGVAQLRENFDFALHIFPALGVGQLGLVLGFYGHFDVCVFVHSLLHHGLRAQTQHLSDCVIVQRIRASLLHYRIGVFPLVVRLVVVFLRAGVLLEVLGAVGAQFVVKFLQARTLPVLLVVVLLETLAQQNVQLLQDRLRAALVVFALFVQFCGLFLLVLGALLLPSTG